MKRRSVNVFSLAFLDVMFCGFGAVILFFMIINAGTHERKEKINYVAQREVEKLGTEILKGKQLLVKLKSTTQKLNDKLTQKRGHSKEIIENIAINKTQLIQQRKEASTTLKNISQLKADLKSLEESNQHLEGGLINTQGKRLLYFPGQGQRQYLTGLKMDGERILILVDNSASMLADRIINVLRFRNLPAEKRAHAAKWQQVIHTVGWITAHIPRTSKFQVYVFNETSAPAHTEVSGRWLDADNVKHLDSVISSFYGTVPANGTNLYNAFKSIDELTPPPDNIYLLTDGLPTQGESGPFNSKISAKERKKLFDKALKKLPLNVPVNIILFHMEGDPDASSLYWKLAQKTNGAFISPSKDWP